MEPGPQFHQYKKTTYRIEPDPVWPRRVRAVQDNTDKMVGGLAWWPDNHYTREPERNAVANVDVLKNHRGRGIADAMLHYAKGINPDLHHSSTLTPDGQAWAEKHPI